MAKDRFKKSELSWLTTDAEEYAKRKERAVLEPMKVRAVDAQDGFGRYEVSHPAADRRTVVYHVELRSLDLPINTCDCQDFQKSGLNTCKHIERALRTAARKCGSRHESSVGEVFMGREPYCPRFLAGERLAADDRRKLVQLCDANGSLKDRSAAGLEVFLRICERINRVHPGSIRISFEVRNWLEAQTRREALSRAVTEAREQLGGDGRWPFLKKRLLPYQLDGVMHLAGKGRAILADEMGLGKTVQGIAAALLMKETVGIKRTLVVVPASLKGEWEDQIRFFSDATFESVYGMRQTRLERFAQTRAFFIIANYEQVVRDWKEINELLHPDLVILDEAQRIKNWKTKTARCIKGLVSPYAFVLTGTPLENRIDELYSIVDYVNPKLFGSLFRFNRRFYAFDDVGKNEGMCNLEQLHELTSQVLLRRRKVAVENELPGRLTKTYKTGMTAEQHRRYSEHMKTVAELYQLSKRRPLSPKEQERLQIALGLMRMLCDSCYITDPKVKESPKLDEFEHVLDDILHDDPGRKVIVFSEWTRMLDLLIERLERKHIGYALHTGQVNQKQRRQEIRRFKEDPQCQVFLASESGGVGLNLQVASVVVNLDLPWNPAKLEQRIARAWRKNQQREVLVVNMVAASTIEERMLQTLSFKQGLADFVLDAIGDASDFEYQNREQEKGGKKPSAFMQRLASIMGGEPLKVEPEPVSRAVSHIPPDERLRAAMESDFPNLERMTMLKSNEGGPRGIGGAVVVGRALDKELIANQIAETHGTVLPNDRIETIEPETWALMKRLEKLGVIRFQKEVLKDVVVRPTPDFAQVEARKRMENASRRFAEVVRQQQMGELLMQGGFEHEARMALCKAVSLAAAVACYARGEGVVDANVEPTAMEDFTHVCEVLKLSPNAALVLQMAVQGLDFPDAVESARKFCESCRPE